MSRRNSFTLTIMVIIMAVLAIFIGYLIGSWLIQVVTGNPEPNQQVAQKKIIEEEIIDDQNKDQQNSSNPESSFTNKDKDDNKKKLPQYKEPSQEPTTESQIKQSISGQVYLVQVGAFSKQGNALTLKNELESKGFQVVITDDQSRYKVQLGASNEREEAEDTEEELESLGYDAFITH